MTWTWVALRSLIRSSRERQVKSPGSGGKSRPWKRFQADGRELHRRSIRRLTKRDFLTGEELGAFELSELLDLALELKAGRRQGVGAGDLAGRSVALVFEKPSTRTRISFEVGVAELGATPIVLRGDELQLSRGESIGDTARVLSRYVDAIVIRSGSHEEVAELAAEARRCRSSTRSRRATIPARRSPTCSPCASASATSHGLRVAYVGDGNNVARSLAIAGRAGRGRGRGRRAGRLPARGGPRREADRATRASPPPAPTRSTPTSGSAWATRRRPSAAAPTSPPSGSTPTCFRSAKDSAVVLHCLPAHPGEEITAEVLYGPRSAVWDQAENRLHTQKALLSTLLGEVGDVYPEIELGPLTLQTFGLMFALAFLAAGGADREAAEGDRQAGRLGL